MMTDSRFHVVDVVVGGLVGMVVGAIISVNVVIYAGPDEGYESSPRAVFDHNALTGSVALAALVAGPIVGVILARRLRRRSQGPDVAR